MSDQENLPEVNPPEKKPNIFQDWWEEMYPREFFLTFKNYLFNHKKFFDEVFNEQWDNKVKPMAFLFTAIGLSLIIGAISPWGLDFSPEKPPLPAWSEITESMNSEDTEEFITAFGLEEIIKEPNDSIRGVAVVNRLMEATEKSEPLNAKELQTLFKENGYDLLAARAEYVVLKQKVAHDQEVKDGEIGEFAQIILLNLFVLWSMIFWLLSHRFFKKANRTSRETIHVYMYGLGMLVFLVYVPFIAISGAIDETMLGIGGIVVLALLIIILYRIFSIFKYTHNTGFWSLMYVYIKTFLLAILYGIPLLILIGLVLNYLVL